MRAAAPEVDEATLCDRALRAALARLRAEVSRETFLYLAWKVERARRETQATRAAIAAGRVARDDAPA